METNTADESDYGGDDEDDGDDSVRDDFLSTTSSAEISPRSARKTKTVEEGRRVRWLATDPGPVKRGEEIATLLNLAVLGYGA